MSRKTKEKSIKKPKKRLSNKKVLDLIEEILEPFMEEEKYCIYHKEFVKEGPNWFLRVFIEKLPSEGEEWPENVTADDCEKVSKYLSKELDEIDPIERNYYLEISSPGMGRPLLKEEHFQRYKNHLVDVRLYRGLDGKKTISGKLLGLNQDNCIEIEDEEGKVYVLPEDLVARINLTVVF